MDGRVLNMLRTKCGEKLAPAEDIADILRMMSGDNYIWQRADWPVFRWDAARVAGPLATARFRQGLLLGRMERLGFDLGQAAEWLVRTDEVVQTASIEGEILDRAEVRSSVARRMGIDAPGAFAKRRDIDGLVDVLFDATSGFAERLTRDRLFGWHRELLGPESRVAVGRWRDDSHGPMQVVSGPMGHETVHFEAVPAVRIDAEVSRFLAFVNDESDEDGLLRAALAHLWFVTIHPFEDGNGRLARAVTELLLARSEGSPHRFYSMSDQVRQDRTGYYRALEWTQKGDLDVTDWVLWFLETLRAAFDRSAELLAGIERRDAFWRRTAEASLNERQLKVLRRLLEDDFEGFVTSSKWARMAGTSQDTAGRDIRDLVHRGILTPNEGGGRSTSYRVAGVG